MRKIYAFVPCFFLLLTTFLSYGLNITHSANEEKKKAKFSGESFMDRIPGPVTPHALGCDTLLYSPTLSTTYGAVSYTAGAGNGYVAGTNKYGDKQKGNFFDVTGSANSNYVTGVRFALAKVNGTDLTKTVYFRVYTFNANNTLTLAGSSDAIPLSALKPNVGTLVDYTFPTAIPLTNKAFIISLDISNLSWAAKDSLSVFSSRESTTSNVPDSAVEQWSDDSWNFMSTAWGFNKGIFLYIFPYVSNNINCTLAVGLSNFTAGSFGAYNRLTWTTVTESKNSGFEIERSPDGIKFEKINLVSSKAEQGNSSRPISYTFTDEHPYNGNNFYRLSQRGNSNNKIYSKTVLVNRSTDITKGVLSFYPNPVKTNLNIVLATSGANNKLQVINVNGVTLIEKNIHLSASNQNITLNVSSLPKGTYFVRISGEKNNLKFVKE
jgi:hypothetical protein